MNSDKAYKILALQEGISNSKAKELIDKGLITANGKKVVIARGEVPIDTRFKIQQIKKTKIIFEDGDILAVDKQPYLNASDLEKEFRNYTLLNRLDRETSGVMLFAKNEEFRSKAIKEFRDNRVYKEYIAVVEGKIIDEIEIDKPILTIKGDKARSKIDFKKGKSAKSYVYPLFIEGNKSKVKVVIETGRTHQIRVHLSSIGHPIIGDSQYGKKSDKVNRVMLHSHVTKLLGYEFISAEPKEFKSLNF
jgi:23S rRNA pseudouridine1911/1915/1917 synthase